MVMNLRDIADRMDKTMMDAITGTCANANTDTRPPLTMAALDELMARIAPPVAVGFVMSATAHAKLKRECEDMAQFSAPAHSLDSFHGVPLYIDPDMTGSLIDMYRDREALMRRLRSIEIRRIALQGGPKVKP